MKPADQGRSFPKEPTLALARVQRPKGLSRKS
jgi:hypothetical protein